MWRHVHYDVSGWSCLYMFALCMNTELQKSWCWKETRKGFVFICVYLYKSLLGLPYVLGISYDVTAQSYSSSSLRSGILIIKKGYSIKNVGEERTYKNLRFYPKQLFVQHFKTTIQLLPICTLHITRLDPHHNSFADFCSVYEVLPLKTMFLVTTPIQQNPYTTKPLYNKTPIQQKAWYYPYNYIGWFNSQSLFGLLCPHTLLGLFNNTIL